MSSSDEEEEFQEELELTFPRGIKLKIYQDRLAGTDAFCGVVWHQGVRLSKFLAACAENLEGLNGIDLGAGCGVVSLVAQRLGAQMCATDLPYAMPHLTTNINSNLDAEHVDSIALKTLTWGDDSDIDTCLDGTSDSKGLTGYDLIFATDVLFRASLVPTLFNTIGDLSRRVHQNERSSSSSSSSSSTQTNYSLSAVLVCGMALRSTDNSLQPYNETNPSIWHTFIKLLPQTYKCYFLYSEHVNFDRIQDKTSSSLSSSCPDADSRVAEKKKEEKKEKGEKDEEQNKDGEQDQEEEKRYIPLEDVVSFATASVRLVSDEYNVTQLVNVNDNGDDKDNNNDIEKEYDNDKDQNSQNQKDNTTATTTTTTAAAGSPSSREQSKINRAKTKGKAEEKENDYHINCAVVITTGVWLLVDRDTPTNRLPKTIQSLIAEALFVIS